MTDRMATRLEAAMPLKHTHQQFRGYLETQQPAPPSDPSTWPSHWGCVGKLPTRAASAKPQSTNSQLRRGRNLVNARSTYAEHTAAISEWAAKQGLEIELEPNVWRQRLFEEQQQEVEEAQETEHGQKVNNLIAHRYAAQMSIPEWNSQIEVGEVETLLAAQRKELDLERSRLGVDYELEHRGLVSESAKLREKPMFDVPDLPKPAGAAAS